jgi:hypothetical protein
MARCRAATASSFFATGNPAWDETLSKFSIRTPSIEGQYPRWRSYTAKVWWPRRVKWWK